MLPHQKGIFVASDFLLFYKIDSFRFKRINFHLLIVHVNSYYHGQRLERVPYFLTTPSNGSYREGSAVRLTCEATGKIDQQFIFFGNVF